MRYCRQVWKTQRRKTREIQIGNVLVGGCNPIRIQSMTTSDTRNTNDTVEQIIRLSDAGCEIARVTVQGKKEAESCEKIKNALISKGYTIPLVADIHFYPPAAMTVIDFVEKVRINPGNYSDKRAVFKRIEYKKETYTSELQRIEEKFSPLVLKCKKLNKAMRLGINHGSLSDRIMSRYGDTPKGMVESALEYAQVCRNLDFHNFLFSMKSSNTHVMIQAYRLLADKMLELGWDYPLHLGVTEAGKGEDGRIKSSIGIGSLLLDGIGDTIRVSLTEDPWMEIDPCKRLKSFSESYLGKGTTPFEEKHRKAYEFHKRKINVPKGIHLHRTASVALKVSTKDRLMADFYPSIGLESIKGCYEKKTDAAELILEEGAPRAYKELEALEISVIKREPKEERHIILQNLSDEIKKRKFSALIISNESEEEWEKIKRLDPSIILLRPLEEGRIHYARKFFDWLEERQLKYPVFLNFYYSSPFEDAIIAASSECGSLLCDGLGDGLLLEGPYPLNDLRNLSFAILQGSRQRTVKTEFISCPGCGRTLFDLQEVSEKIKQSTGHLPGVKIAIMGCIVNGPGEMNDADFGYVGTRPGKIDLYVGKTCVEKNIDHNDAEKRLIELIKANGMWVERKPCLSEYEKK